MTDYVKIIIFFKLKNISYFERGIKYRDENFDKY